jgi:hypothetical protein
MFLPYGSEDMRGYMGCQVEGPYLFDLAGTWILEFGLIHRARGLAEMMK